MSLSYLARNNRRYALGDFGGVPLYYPMDNLTGFWRPSVSTTTLKDISVNGFDGTLSGSSPPTLTPSCLGPKSLQFTTAGNVNFSAAVANFNTASFSCGCWFLLGTTGLVSLIDCNNQTNYGWGLNLNQHSGGSASTGYATLWIYKTGGWQAGAYTITTPWLTPGCWFHICCTYASGGSAIMYVNGSTSGCGSATVTNVVYSSNAFTLGGDSSSGQYMRGLMTDIFLYSRVLTSTEVTNIYKAGYV
jgi:hypothetical protein